MLFSLLIANYNNARFLDECLQSVFQQSYENWEIILVDDGSTDNFEEIINKHLPHHRIKVFRNGSNQGCGATKRKCLEHATGNILAFLDPDDALPPEALRVMVDEHRIREHCSIIHSTHYVCDELLKPERISTKPRKLPDNTPYLFLNDGSIHAFASFKKACYDQTEGLVALGKKDKAVDQDLYYKLEETGEVHFINLPLYYYRIHKGSISNMGQEAEAMKFHYNIIETACLRRIRKLKHSNSPHSAYWTKRYRTHYYKIRILNSFRKKSWGRFAGSVFLFPFVGGMGNIISYTKKIPREGFTLFRRSFLETYKH